MDAQSRESLLGRIVHSVCFASFIGGIILFMFGQLKLSLLLIGAFALILVAERLLSPGTGTWNDLRIATVADTVVLLSVTFAFIFILWGAYTLAGILFCTALAGISVSFVKKPF